ncbi:MAG: hypothetical protein U5K31_08400 [Balneolaceae bacterium]|nr:hypothetical protein [Balneolaceae bacterium]
MNESREIALIRKIDAYVKGTLSDDQEDELWAELLQKPDYIDYLETELAVRDLVRGRNRVEGDRRDGEIADRGSTSIHLLSGRWGRVAAAAAVLIATLAYLYWGLPQQPEPGQLALTQIDTRTELALPTVTRGEGDLGTADSLLNAGYHALVLGNRGEALRLFSDLARDRNGEADAARAHLNIGILEYNAGRFAPADSAFHAAASNEEGPALVREKAWWFLGNTLLRTERTAEAREALEQAASLQGPYEGPARRLLEQLPSGD